MAQDPHSFSPSRPNRALEDVTRPPDGRSMEAQPQWRKDFPIDWEQDHYVARREFSKFMVLTSMAFAVGQAWIVGRSFWRKSRGLLPLSKIANHHQLPVGQTLVFQYPTGKDSCVLVRLTEDRYVAYSQECTHLSCAVVPRPEKGILQCPCHEGSFDLLTGRELAGPPRRPLPRVLLESRIDGLYATGMERQG